MPLMAAIPAAKIGLSLVRRARGGGRKAPKTRRRRRMRLTAGERNELLWIKNNIGRTAAAAYLGSYMGRGG